MAINAACIWEIRQDATPSNANGGGYVTGMGGSDFSQQTAAQYNLTGVTTAAANAILLSASAASDMVGNIAHIVSGTNFTVGWYEIISVVVGVSITVDRNATTAAGTTGVVNIGGAMSINSTLDDEFFESIVAGNLIYVRKTSSDLALGESVAISSGGGASAALPVRIIGYDGAATRADIPIGANRPLIARGTFGFTLASFWFIENVRNTGASTNGVSLGISCHAINCTSFNSSQTADLEAWTVGTTSFIENCEGVSYRGNAVELAGTAGLVRYSYLHDSNIGYRSNHATADSCIGNIIASNMTAACVIATAQTVQCQYLQNTFYGSEGGDGLGLSIVTGTTIISVLNNIFYGFVRAIEHADAVSSGYGDYNCYRQNDLANSNWPTGPHDTTNDPAFTDVTEITFNDATISGAVITSAMSDFSAVVDGVDFVWLISGTAGPVFMKYLIGSHTPTTLTVTPAAIGNSAVADHVGIVALGHDYYPTGDI